MAKTVRTSGSASVYPATATISSTESDTGNRHPDRARGDSPEPAEPASSKRARPPHVPEAAILLVDDSPANLLVLEVVLEPLGHVLVRAQSGAEALQLVDQHTFALIVLDVMMPGMDGFQTAALIRERHPDQRIPIIFLSAFSGEASSIHRGYASGAVDYLVKPVDPEILRSKASVFLELFAQKEEIRRQATLLVAHERARAEHAAQSRIHEVTRRAEQRFRALINTMSQIVWTANAEGRAVDDSPSWRAFTGQTVEEWLDPAGAIRAVHPDDQSNVRRAWSEAIADGLPFYAEYRLRRADGEYRCVGARAVPVQKDDSGVHEWVGTITDIDDRKKLDAEIEASMTWRERLLAIVGHDLRNPLAAIQLDSRSLLERQELATAESRRIARIAKAAARMERMVTQLLDHARARLGGGIPVELQETNLSAVCRQLVEELEVAHPGRAIVYAETAAIVGRFDPDRLGEVLTNLVGNALQHAPQSTVTVRLHAHASEAVLEIHNWGDPIPAQLLPHLFDPFRRGKQETRSSSLGLGLFIAQQIVAAHGGRLEVSSTTEDGTRFTATLPLVDLDS